MYKAWGSSNQAVLANGRGEPNNSKQSWQMAEESLIIVKTWVSLPSNDHHRMYLQAKQLNQCLVARRTQKKDVSAGINFVQIVYIAKLLKICIFV